MLINHKDDYCDNICYADHFIYVSSIYNLVYQELTNFPVLNLTKKLSKHLVQHANFKKLNSIDLINMVVGSIMEFYKKNLLILK